MLNTLLSRALSAPDSPSADLYFLNACSDYLRLGVKRLAPTVFASDSACLVVRHDMRLGQLPTGRRLYYLIDDDVDAGLHDLSLPFFYRQKLRLVESPAGRRLAPVADGLVVSSAQLARTLGTTTPVHVLLPHWSDPQAPLDHFGPFCADEGQIDIAFLGSSVHRSDLSFLLPVIRHVLDRFDRVRFHIPMRHGLPGDLLQHERVLRIPGAGWTAYRRELRMRRFHIALYPLLDTPFNRGRSINKLIEHGVVGAAPIYSRSWAEASRVTDGRTGVLADNTVPHWIDAIAGLITQPVTAAAIAHGAQRLAADLNDPLAQRRLWARLFGLTVHQHA